MSALPNGLITFGPSANCTLELCPLEASILQYQPSTAATAVAIAIFGLSLILNIGQGVYHQTWAFMACLVSGCILEIAGYIGRIIINGNPFDFNGFLMQIICITVAPIFFCAAIYVLLVRIILLIDERLSRISPRYLSWIFISFDVISLVLQAVGGALSCVGENKDDIQVGTDISLAGLIFQVVTLTLFVALFVDYLSACRQYSNHKALTRQMNFFLSFLFLSILLILLRCVYRVVELHGGYFSHFFRDEPLFIALETAIMCAAAVCLNVGHPGLIFGRRKGDPIHREAQHALL
ncbi:parasitic phase-specific protein PSP-1 [Aspergillus caelatus]|uniref:Parasitic phase-specific protein PSP-1 n=1 Tax=Aspergillus caelatus TaxID=61420 RepID=A0A5N6ZJ32_9EURO|nr:parasitic phase-specific protein PSP-1 [Aspergillus caelatus]KAE8357495.1 parasitic phase-specific protein PSP-1 [Aspergillus caelatus]